MLVIGPGAGSQAAAADRLEAALRREPGVASVVGPSALPASASSANPMIARDGRAIRFALVYDTDPLNAAAIGQVRVLTARLPALGRAAGLRGVRYEVGGQTALTSDAITSTASDLWRVGLAILLVTLLLLMVFLLVALGSDYNVFVVGRIWEEARELPAQDAVAVAAPRASRAITTAGAALAASFGLLALIPLEQFRQLAIIMAVGVMLDSIVVRSFLVPALVALTGRFGMWPGHQRVRAAARRPAEYSSADREPRIRSH